MRWIKVLQQTSARGTDGMNEVEERSREGAEYESFAAATRKGRLEGPQEACRPPPPQLREEE